MRIILKIAFTDISEQDLTPKICSIFIKNQTNFHSKIPSPSLPALPQTLLLSLAPSVALRCFPQVLHLGCCFSLIPLSVAPSVALRCFPQVLLLVDTS